MPEHEIAKHTKAIYTAWKNPAHGWKHKLGEIGIEIFIIVFAITLSLFVERWRENSHERTLEKQFLMGLKKDLQGDLQQYGRDSLSYVFLQKGWNYFYTAGSRQRPINKDSVEMYTNTLFNLTIPFTNSTRFEALKSSGQLGVIEDDSLQNNILDLYQNKLASLGLSLQMFNEVKTEHLAPYLMQNLHLQKDALHKDEFDLVDLIQQPVFRNYLAYRSISYEILDRYHGVMQQSRIIIHMIDEQYHLK